MIPKKHLLWQIVRSKERSNFVDTSVLVQVAGLYGLGREKWDFRPAGDGFASNTYVIRNGLGKWVLKQYREQFQPQAIIFIHSLLMQLEQQGFPASRLNFTPSGQNYVEMNGCCYAMFYYDPGYRGDLYMMTKSLRHRHIRQAGTTLARFHWLTANMVLNGQKDHGYKTKESHERWDSYDDYPNRWSELAKAIQPKARGPLITDVVSGRISDKMGKLAQIEKRRVLLPISITHGDYGPWNLLFRPFATLSSVIDFDDVALEERIEEVAAGILSFAGKPKNWLNIEDARVFLESYHQVYPLAPDELQALPSVFERHFLKRTLVISKRFITLGRKEDQEKFLNMVSWLDWLESSGGATLRELITSLERTSLEKE